MSLRLLPLPTCYYCMFLSALMIVLLLTPVQVKLKPLVFHCRSCSQCLYYHSQYNFETELQKSESEDLTGIQNRREGLTGEECSLGLISFKFAKTIDEISHFHKEEECSFISYWPEQMISEFTFPTIHIFSVQNK